MIVAVYCRVSKDGDGDKGDEARNLSAPGYVVIQSPSKIFADFKSWHPRFRFPRLKAVLCGLEGYFAV